MGTESNTLTDREALEHLVVDNDDLLELEELIGRFNIFDALGIARVEIRHSNFLAWLLDPAESHGQGSIFLKAVLMDLFKQAPVDKRPLSPVDLDGLELRGVQVRREWRGIDVLITSRNPEFAVAVENKIESGEHGNQLARYEGTIEQEFPDLPAQNRVFVFLTPEGEEASSEHWVPYSYGDLHRVLGRCCRANQGAIGQEVRVFLDHYLHLIRSQSMDDPRIDELCKRIYSNHRQALQLIYDRVGPVEGGLLEDVEQLLRKGDVPWHVINRTARRIVLVPPAWSEWLPPIGRHGDDKRLWIVWNVFCHRGQYKLGLEVWDTTDHDVRMKVIKAMCDEAQFGCRTFFLTPETKWNRVSMIKVAAWEEEDELDRDKVLDTLKKKLAEQLKRLERLPDVLRSILG